MNGFEKRAERIKEKIMDTTLEMLQTWELKKIRIADISRMADVSQVTIYNYFGSKEALLREVFKKFTQESLSEFETFLNGDHSLKEKVEYIIFQKKKNYKKYSLDFMHKILVEDPEMKDYIEQEYRQKVIPLMTRLIMESRERGEISSQVSIDTIMMFIHMFIEQAKQLLEFAEQKENMDEFIEEMVQIFFYGICGESSP